MAKASIRWPAIYPKRCSQLMLPGQLERKVLEKICQQGKVETIQTVHEKIAIGASVLSLLVGNNFRPERHLAAKL